VRPVNLPLLTILAAGTLLNLRRLQFEVYLRPIRVQFGASAEQLVTNLRKADIVAPVTAMPKGEVCRPRA
jgi:hypothetical protein